MRVLTIKILFLLFVAVTLTSSPVFAEAFSDPNAPVSDYQAALDVQKSLFWQRINAARENPRAVLTRLGIPLEQARASLGDHAWILDYGLLPLAWNDQLRTAAVAHGRDMLDRIYYNQVTPEGVGPMVRIAATGYQAAAEAETLGLLIFKNYVDLETAVDFLLDNLLRDELTSPAGSDLKIFSPEFTELGIGFFAETVTALAGQPHVYLLVIDSAQPQMPRGFVVGQVDAGRRVGMRTFGETSWQLLDVLPGAVIQAPFPARGAEIVMADDQDKAIRRSKVYSFNPNLNRLINLSTVKTLP